MSERRVLAIQSHVVHGYVGNKAATFPLQTLGFDVDPLNVVQFSNHTGYPSFKGQRLGASEVAEILSGLQANGVVDDYSHVLTGYIGNKEVLATIETFVRDVIASRGSAVEVLVDPVMGDFGRMYVSEDVVPAYRSLLSVATITTPNWFEAQLLVGFDVNSTESALRALDRIHEMGPSTAVITSVEVSGDEEHLTLFASDKTAGEKVSVRFPKRKGVFTGTGDLLASLLLAHLSNSTRSGERKTLGDACVHALATIQQVLGATALRAKERVAKASASGDGTLAEMNYHAPKRGENAFLHRANELAIVQSADAIRAPETCNAITDGSFVVTNL